MDGDGGRLHSIGDLARRTGLAVRTIRFYSDGGIVAPAGRSRAGHRLYDAGAVARLDLVRTPRLRRAVLTAAARHGSTPEEMDLMHKLARLSQDERQRLIGDFLDAVFGGQDAEPAFAGIRRSMTLELPDDPEAEQVQAWAPA